MHDEYHVEMHAVSYGEARSGQIEHFETTYTFNRPIVEY
jgi:hypothetical protein